MLNLNSVFTTTEPGNAQHSVELSGGGAGGGASVIWELKVENKHNDKAVFILNWNHIDHTGKTNSCKTTQRCNETHTVILRESSRWR